MPTLSDYMQGYNNGYSDGLKAAKEKSGTRDAPSADVVDEIVPWWKVRELAEKHGKGWSQYSGWAFMNDDDLHAFAQAIAASAPKGDGND